MPFSLIATQAAKETETLTAEQHARESIRIARTTRELLKKFASFQKSFTESWFLKWWPQRFEMEGICVFDI